MSLDRTHAPSGSTSLDRDDDDDALTPGRASRSALLRKPADPVPSGLLSRAADRDANGVATDASTAVAATSSSTGSPLPTSLMRKFESSLGADLSGVRVHTGATSAAANDAVGAKAYTLGNDIHFGANNFDPSSSAGEHLLAHEVAHTVQQAGGVARMQYKLDVSSPGDAHEHEADSAADAMISGQVARVTNGSGTIARDAAGGAANAKKTLADGKPEIQLPALKVTLGKLKAGPFDFEAALSGGVTLTQQGSNTEEEAKEAKSGEGKAGEGGGKAAEGKPAEVKSNVSKNGVQIDAEKEFGPESWTWKPNIHGSLGADKDGKGHVSYGLGLSHKGHSFDNLDVGPYSLELNLFQWDQGAEPEVLCLTASVPIKLTSKQEYQGYHVKGSITIEVSVAPDVAELAKWIGEELGTLVSSGLAGAAAAIFAPLAIFAGGLYGWSKAGHEFDDLSNTVDGFHAKVQMAAQEAITGTHTAINIPGQGDLNSDTTAAAAQVRKAMETQLKIPAGSLGKIGKSRPGLASEVYQMAWKSMWPGVRAHLMEVYADTTFTNNFQYRQFIEGYDKGTYTES